MVPTHASTFTGTRVLASTIVMGMMTSANVYRALGDLKSFIDDLTMVESLNPVFLRHYLDHVRPRQRRTLRGLDDASISTFLRGQDCLGDFLDEETMTWIPLDMLESICELTKPVLPGVALFAIDSLRRLDLHGAHHHLTQCVQEINKVLNKMNEAWKVQGQEAASATDAVARYTCRRDGRAKNLAVCMDYIRFAGMNSFSLLPQREGPDPREPDDDDDRLRRQNASADTRGGTDSYVSPAIHAMLDLHKCKDSRVVDEKVRVFACHQQLSHRAVRFHEVTSLPFEGFKDMSACIAYYPHDMDMYWYRGHLHRRYHNYSAAIDDFTSCILLTLHLGKPKGAHLHRYKKMVLARATMYVHEMQWELALDDLNEVLHYALRDTQVEASFLLHVYDKRSKVLVALKQYDAAIVDYTSALLDFGKAAPHLRDGYAAIGYVYFCRDMFLEASQGKRPHQMTPLHACGAAYSRCLDERTNDAKILLYRGFSHYRHGERTLAMRDFEKALKIDSSCWFGHFIKAYVHQEEGHGDKAMASIALCMDHFKHVRPFAEIILPVHADRANPFFHGRLDATLEKLKGLALPQPSQGSAGPLTTGRPASYLDRMQWQEIHVWWLANRAHLRATFAKAVRRVLFQSRVVFALEKFAVQATLASITLSKQIDKLTEMQVIAPPQGAQLDCASHLHGRHVVGTFTPGAVAWAYNLVGVLSAKLAKWDDALRNFTMAIRAAPTKPIPHLNRCSLKVDPAHVATLTNAALALRQLSQLEESCRQLYAAVGTQDVAPAALAHIPPHHQQLLYYALANVVRELNRNDEAIEWYTKAAMIETSDHVHLAVRHNRGATMHAQRKFQRGMAIDRAMRARMTDAVALDDYSVALSLQPQSFETRMNRAAVYITTSKCFDALQDLRVAASLQRDSAACSRLLRFCDRWTSALKVACYDFLYAFSAVPCFQDVDITSAAPLFDNYMFRFEHLSHPNHPSRRALEAMLDATDSPDLPDLLYDALMHIQQGSYADAQRALLIAKYSSHTSVHEEQACLVWSAQVQRDSTWTGQRHRPLQRVSPPTLERSICRSADVVSSASIYHHNGDYSSMLDMLHKIFSVMYRGNLTCDIAKHVSHLCVLQGQLATHVEALRDAVKPAPATAATARTPPLLQSAESSRTLVRNSVNGSRRNILRRSSARRLWKPEEVATLNLADFNAAIAKCTAEMIQRPDVPVNDDVLADYVAQYDRVCAFINTASAPNAPVSPLTRDYSRDG
ncbi:hypothetical protein DYB32_007066 [Aphanomyces invadans]|uniref:Uncharacterized protein n=1 Tax=Aphanomyces invadans TaxID=157072 RepID=A0A3R6V7M2_9STRA|nr:hypothetical protein DYB32_007066 [Aphanomyces invadans]